MSYKDKSLINQAKARRDYANLRYGKTNRKVKRYQAKCDALKDGDNAKRSLAELHVITLEVEAERWQTEAKVQRKRIKDWMGL